MRTHQKFCSTKPGSILRTQIPIKTNQWDESVPGFVEADTVAHCGESLSGDFMWSLTVTDIATAWTENRAIWGKGALSVAQAIEAIKHSLPFKLQDDIQNRLKQINHLVNLSYKQKRKAV